MIAVMIRFGAFTHLLYMGDSDYRQVKKPSFRASISWKEVRLAHGRRLKLLNLGSEEQDILEETHHDERIFSFGAPTWFVPEVFSWAAETWDELMQVVEALKRHGFRERYQRLLLCLAPRKPS